MSKSGFGFLAGARFRVNATEIYPCLRPVWAERRDIHQPSYCFLPLLGVRGGDFQCLEYLNSL
jgi:hypothetical protein